MEQVVPVRLDMFQEGKELAQKFKVENSPTSLLMNADEDVFGRIYMFQEPQRYLSMLHDSVECVKNGSNIIKKFNAGRADAETTARATRIFAARRDLDGAKRALNHSETSGFRSEDLARTLIAVAECAVEKGDTAFGLETFNRVLESEPSKDQEGYAYLNISYCCLLQNQYKKSIQFADIVLALTDINPNYKAYAREIKAEAEKGQSAGGGSARDDS